MKKAVQFGAGNIGRGFLGQLFYEAGYETVFVDVKKEVIDLLNERKEYTLRIVGEKAEEITIRNIRAVNAGAGESVVAEVSTADLLCTAVGMNALKFVAPLIAEGLEKRADSGNPSALNIILCENFMNVRAVFREMVLGHVGKKYRKYADDNLGFVQAVVSRMVPVVPGHVLAEDPLVVFVEPYKKLPVDRSGFKGGIPVIPGMVPVHNFPAYEEQKAFTHNAGHAIAAYLGYKKGLNFIYEAIQDTDIRAAVTGAIMDESGQALMNKHGFSREEYKVHVDDLIERFLNRELGDTVARVGKDPVRKLSPDDRLIGGARLSLEYGIEPVNFVKGIKAALAYDNPEDKEAVELQGLLKKNGLEFVLKKVCGLSPDEELFKMIINSSQPAHPGNNRDGARSRRAPTGRVDGQW